MSKKTLTALEIINTQSMENALNTRRERVGKINRNIAFEIRQEKENPSLFHLFVVEYNPNSDETVRLGGHGLLGVSKSEVELRIEELKEVYTDVANEVGQTVEFVQGNYKGVIGEIVQVQRAYKQLGPDGYAFDPEGLVTLEDTIKSISLPYEFDGYTLKVHFPESKFPTFTQHAYTAVSTFYAYNYTVRVATKDLPFNLSGETMLVSILHDGLRVIQ